MKRKSCRGQLATSTGWVGTLATSIEESPKREKMAIAQWTEHKAPSGQSYYYDRVSGKSVWEKPVAFALAAGGYNPGVSQEIQQVGGGVSQGIQQVGGVSQGTQEIPMKKKPKTQNQQAGMAQGYL